MPRPKRAAGRLFGSAILGVWLAGCSGNDVAVGERNAPKDAATGAEPDVAADGESLEDNGTNGGDACVPLPASTSPSAVGTCTLQFALAPGGDCGTQSPPLGVCMDVCPGSYQGAMLLDCETMPPSSGAPDVLWCDYESTEGGSFCP